MTFECLKNCGQCCGLVGIPEQVVKKSEHLKQREVTEIHLIEGEIYAFTEDGLCVFLSKDNNCVIYDDRPDQCRQFGISQDILLQCPYIRPNGLKRNEAKTKRMQRLQHKVVAQSMKMIELKLNHHHQPSINNQPKSLNT